MEERAEVRGLDQAVRRETLDEFERDAARGGDLLGERRDVLDIRLAHLALEVDDRLELVVVGRDVHVHHVLGRTPLGDEVFEVVEYHVAVEHALPADGLSREAVAVVPGLDAGDDFRGVAIRELARPLKVAVELQRLLLGEAEHRVEILVLRDVRGDVEPARQIIHRHGRDARHEDTIETALELLEPFAVESRPMRDGTVRFIARRANERVREVVVFVDDEVEGDFPFARELDYGQELRNDAPPRKGNRECRVIALRIPPHERIETGFQIDVKALLECLAASHARLREVERQHHVPVAVRRRVRADPETAEELLEVRRLAPVVVALQHAGEERLAEAPRPHKEHEPVPRLQFRQVLGFVDIVQALVADHLEIRNAVGNHQVVLWFTHRLILYHI